MGDERIDPRRAYFTARCVNERCMNHGKSHNLYPDPVGDCVFGSILCGCGQHMTIERHELGPGESNPPVIW